MIETTIDTGTVGKMRTRDKTTDSQNLVVEVWIRAPGDWAGVQIPWTYSLDGEMESWKSYIIPMFLYPGGTGPEFEWFRVSMIQVENVEVFTFHLGNTNTEELGGPTDLTIDVYASLDPSTRMVDVRVDGMYRKAVPYVKVDGAWRVAQPFVRDSGVWKAIS